MGGGAVGACGIGEGEWVDSDGGIGLGRIEGTGEGAGLLAGATIAAEEVPAGAVATCGSVVVGIILGMASPQGLLMA